MLYAPPTSSLASWLHSVSNEQTATPELCYYDDETLERQRGRIILNSSTELVDDISLTDIHAFDLRHLFAIHVRSSCRTGNRRTYCMAANTDEELAEWLDVLRGVLKTYGLCGKGSYKINDSVNVTLADLSVEGNLALQCLPKICFHPKFLTRKNHNIQHWSKNFTEIILIT